MSSRISALLSRPFDYEILIGMYLEYGDSLYEIERVRLLETSGKRKPILEIKFEGYLLDLKYHSLKDLGDYISAITFVYQEKIKIFRNKDEYTVM